MTTEEDGNSLDGTPPEQFAPGAGRRAAPTSSASTAASGPAPMLETIERMARVSRRAGSSAQPNAGQPRDVEGRNIYLCSPEYMASYARRFIARRACGSSAAAAARRPSTSGRSRWPSKRWRRTWRGAVAAGATTCGAAGRRARPHAARRPRAARGEVARSARARARHASSPASSWCRRAATRRRRRRPARRAAPAAASTWCTIPDGPRARRAHERARRWRCWSSSRPASRRCCSTRAATATCSACSRTCSARTRWACATCSASPATCATLGDYPGRDGGVRRRLDRPDQRGEPPEPRARHRRPADRRARRRSTSA